MSTAGAAALAFLDALAGPAAQLLGHYAAEAPLWVGGRVVPRREVDAEAFLHAVAAGPSPGRPTLNAPALSHVQEADDQAVAWFEAREAVEGGPLTGAVGLVREGGTWRAAWATLAAPADWSFALGQAQALGEAGFAAPMGFSGARAWLDVAYHRTHLAPRPALRALPEARFACGSSLGCCDIGFAIEIPAAMQALVDALPWAELAPELAGTRLAAAPAGMLKLKDAGERCRFLDERKRCRIHAALGWNPFPVCSAYPVQFTATPDGVDVSLAMTCPSARTGLGPPLLRDPEDLYRRLAANPAHARDRFRLAADLEVPWEAFRAAEDDLQACLAAGDRPLLDRLWEGERRLAAHLGEPPLPAERPGAAPGLVAARAAFFDEALAFVEADHRPAGHFADAPVAALDAELAASVRSLLHTKNFSFPLDLRTAWRVGALLALLGRHLAARSGGDLPQTARMRLNEAFFHSPLFTRLRPDPAAAAALMDAFGQPGFGAELLAAEAPGGTLAVPDDWLAPPPADPDGWRMLDAQDLDAAFAFLADAPLVTLPMLDMLSTMRTHGLDLGRMGWFGRRAGGRWRAIVTSRSCLWAHAPEPAYHAEVAMLVDQLRQDTPWLQVAEELGAAVLARLAAPASDRAHLVMTLDPADLLDVAPDPAVRAATEAEIPAVIANEAAMLREESGYDPLAADPDGFAAVVGRRVRDGRVFVLEEEGRIRYQIGLGYLVPELGLGELVNAYVPADQRGRGYARRGLPQACRLAFRLCGRLVVTPRPDHPVVVALDRSVGFQEVPQRLREATWALH